MLRISIINEDSRTVINLEGKLTGEWVKELEQSWNKAKLEHEGKPVEVVLRAVSYEDEAGKKLLADLAAQGAELKGCGCMTGALIQEIVSGVKTKLAALSGKKSLALIAMLLTLGACQSLRAQEPAPLKLKVGDVAPDFKLQYFDGSNLKDVSLSEYRGKSNVVVAFYIFAFTGG